MYKEHSECRVCDGQLLTEWNLGLIYPSNFIHKWDNSNRYEKVPLELTKCASCGLYQLKHTLNLDSMYRRYWYKSNLNKSMVQDLKDVVSYAESKVDLKDKDMVVDIGCNDGTLFEQYKNKTLYKVGFDPALNIDARTKCDLFINDYFGDYYQLRIAKVITTIAMFYDLEDPVFFVKNIKDTLAKDGIWIIQLTDLYSMFLTHAFDNIVHEHLEYYTLEWLDRFMKYMGLEVIDADHNYVNGRSLRICVAWPGVYKRSYIVNELIKIEKTSYEDNRIIKELQNSMNYIKETILDYLSNNRVYGLGASTKGNTLLQLF